MLFNVTFSFKEKTEDWLDSSYRMGLNFSLLETRGSLAPVTSVIGVPKN